MAPQARIADLEAENAALCERVELLAALDTVVVGRPLFAVLG